MKFIAHRINTIEALKKTPKEFGVEIDLRDTPNGGIHIAHDPFEQGEDFEKYLQHYQHSTMILNIKSERIEFAVQKLLQDFGIADYFFLDSSFPMIYTLSDRGEKKIALRFSEFESVKTLDAMAGKVDWIWIDCFTRLPIDKGVFQHLKALGYQICLVSPELQGRPEDISVYNQYLKRNQIQLDAICCKTHNVSQWR